MTKNQTEISMTKNQIISIENIIISKYFIKISLSSNCDFVYIVFIFIIKFRKRKHLTINFEIFFSAFVNNVHFFLKNTFKFEKNHDFQFWFNDIIIVVQIVNCFFFRKRYFFKCIYSFCDRQFKQSNINYRSNCRQKFNFQHRWTKNSKIL